MKRNGKTSDRSGARFFPLCLEFIDKAGGISRGRRISPDTTGCWVCRMSTGVKLWFPTKNTQTSSFIFTHPPEDFITSFYKKLKNVSCEYDRVNG